MPVFWAAHLLQYFALLQMTPGTSVRVTSAHSLLRSWRRESSRSGWHERRSRRDPHGG